MKNWGEMTVHRPFIEDVGAKDEIISRCMVPIAPVGNKLMRKGYTILTSIFLGQQQHIVPMVGLPNFGTKMLRHQASQSDPSTQFKHSFPSNLLWMFRQPTCQRHRRFPEQKAVWHMLNFVHPIKQRILIRNAGDLPGPIANGKGNCFKRKAGRQIN